MERLLSKKEYRNYILLIANFIFYGAGEPIFVFVMIGSIILNYSLALAIEKEHFSSSLGLFHSPKFFLILDVILNIGLLVAFKYLNLFIKSTNDRSSKRSENVVVSVGDYMWIVNRREEIEEGHKVDNFYALRDNRKRASGDEIGIVIGYIADVIRNEE